MGGDRQRCQTGRSGKEEGTGRRGAQERAGALAVPVAQQAAGGGGPKVSGIFGVTLSASGRSGSRGWGGVKLRREAATVPLGGSLATCD